MFRKTKLESNRWIRRTSSRQHRLFKSGRLHGRCGRRFFIDHRFLSRWNAVVKSRSPSFVARGGGASMPPKGRNVSGRPGGDYPIPIRPKTGWPPGRNYNATTGGFESTRVSGSGSSSQHRRGDGFCTEPGPDRGGFGQTFTCLSNQQTNSFGTLGSDVTNRRRTARAMR